MCDTLAGVWCAVVVSLCIAACWPSDAVAGIIAVTFPDRPIDQSTLANEETIGWQFSVNSTISLTMLGWFDGGNFQATGDGLKNAHRVGLWEASTQTFLAGIEIPSGTAGLLDEHFRFMALDIPVLLSPGMSYVIAGTHAGANDDNIISLNEPKSVDLAITFEGMRISSGAGGTSLTFPNTFGPYPEYTWFVGPNFQFAGATAAVPEPSTFALCATGGLLFALRRRRGGSRLADKASKPNGA